MIRSIYRLRRSDKRKQERASADAEIDQRLPIHVVAVSVSKFTPPHLGRVCPLLSGPPGWTMSHRSVVKNYTLISPFAA